MTRFACCLGSGFPFAPEDTKPQFLPDTTFRTEHVRIRLTLDLERKTAACVCTTTLTILAPDARKVVFDAVDMKVLGVHAAGRKLAFRHRGAKNLEVTLPSKCPAGTRLELEIAYRLSDPRGGLTFVGHDRHHPGRSPQAWTQGQTDDARRWFPCRDVPAEKATTEVIATVPDGFRAISNGMLDSEEAGPGRGMRTFHWRMNRPHSLYLVTLTVGRFGEVAEEWDGIPILYYCERGREDEARRGFGKTPKAVRFFSEYTGVRYPYEKYAQIAAADFLGGMENTSATTQMDIALLDARAALDVDFDGLVSHELAHQWFGDLVTCREWSHAWLNESFATYFEILFLEHDKGLDEARYVLWQYANEYFEENAQAYSRPTVTRRWRESFQLFDCHLYQRGACVLHFLRHVLGEDAWRGALRHYLEKHGYGCVETRDLVEAFRVATGRNLDRYFEEWLFRAGHPELHAALSWDPAAKEATLRIAQKGAIGGPRNAYEFPIDVRFQTPGGTFDARVELKEAEHAFVYRLPAEPEMAWIDPDGHLPIVRTEWVKPARCWRNQLARDPHVAGRIAAAETIAGWGTTEAAALLERALAREKFWGVRVEIARALGRMRTAAAREALRRAMGVPHPKVRRAVVEALGEFQDPSLVDAFARIARRDPSVLVSAAAVRALGRTRSERAAAAIRRAHGVASWADVVRAAAVGATVELAGKWEAARPYLGPSHPPRVRAAAIGALASLAHGDPGAARELLKWAKDPCQLVRISAIRSLRRVGDPSVHAELKKLGEKAGNSMERAMIDSTLRSLRAGQATDLPRPERRTPKPGRNRPRATGKRSAAPRRT
ncbi:MAG: HEAT repeat domain-containing protein [Planctomycetes bacterium]|nr:HEAT repeat domain-containing protein [Planctomycetota bacterium]